MSDPDVEQKAPARRNSAQRPRPQTGRLVVAGALVLIGLVVLWELRTIPLIHDLVLRFWADYPQILFPFLAAALCFGPLARVIRRNLQTHDSRFGRRPYHDPVSARDGALLITAGVLWLALMVTFYMFYGAWAARAIMQDNAFADITRLPTTASVRTVPFDVLDRMAQNGFSSTTQELENGHMIVGPGGKLVFTHEVAPSGVLRRRSEPTIGIATQDPLSTDRTLKVIRSNDPFTIAPSTKGWFFKPWTWKRSLRIAAYRKHYLTRIQEYTGIVTASGEVLFLAPYYTYKGLLVRRPVVGGVFVAHPNGRVEDLSLAQARRRPELAASGRVLPEDYVRKVQAATRYRYGIWNGKFGRRDVYALGDSAATGNRQPYLTVLADGRPAWISTLTPKGKSNATGAVMVTDAVTARTEIWTPPDGDFLTGPQRALDAVQGQPIGGITWSNGNYDAIEPRPLILSGRLHYLISVVPANRSTVAKSVIFDAQRNKVVAIFDHESTDGDQRLEAYIKAGASVEQPDGSAPSPSTPPTNDDNNADAVRRRLDALIADNEREHAELLKLREQLSGSP